MLAMKIGLKKLRNTENGRADARNMTRDTRVIESHDTFHRDCALILPLSSLANTFLASVSEGFCLRLVVGMPGKESGNQERSRYLGTSAVSW
jgi:hypothetical protein